MANISRNVEINIKEGSNPLRDEFAFLKSGRVSLNVEFTGNSGFDQIRSLRSDLSSLQGTLQNIEGSLGTISSKMTNIYSQITSGARSASQAVNGLSQAQQQLGSGSTASSGFVKQLQANRREIEATARLLNRRGVSASNFTSQDSAVEAQFRRIEAAQNRNAANPVRQASTILRSESLIKKLESKIDQVPPEEAFAALFGGESGRRRNRLERADQLIAQNPGLVGLESRLKDRALSGDLGKIFDFRRLRSPEAATQIAFSALEGGSPISRVSNIGASTLGAAFAGGPGALFASTVATTLVEPLIQAFESKREKFREAGEAYSEAILSISSTLHESTQLVSSQTGIALGRNQNIEGQLAFRERQAEGIQKAVRSELLPLGIGGASEASIARSVTGALAQRGFEPDTRTIALGARALGGTAAALNPSLLSTGRLPKDIEDILLAQGKGRNTSLGQLLPEDSYRAIQNARSNSDLQKAFQTLQSFGDAYSKSGNPVAVKQRISGQEELLNSVGGNEQLAAQTEALRYREQVLTSDKDLAEASRNLGRVFGSLEGASIKFQTGLEQLAAKLTNTTVDVTGFKPGGEIPGVAKDIIAKLTGQNSQVLGPILDLVTRLGGGNSSPPPFKSEQTDSGKLSSRLKALGLDSEQQTFDTKKSPFAQLAGVEQSIKEFAGKKDLADQIPFLQDQRARLLQETSSLQAKTLPPTDEGNLRRLGLEGRSDQSQIRARQDQLKATKSLELGASPERLAELQGQEKLIQNQILELRAKGLGYAQQEAALYAKRAGEIRGTTDFNTVAGLTEGTKGIADALRLQFGAAKRGGASSQQLGDIFAQRLANEDLAARARGVAIQNRNANVNRESFAGQEREIENNRSGRTAFIEGRESLIRQRQAALQTEQDPDRRRILQQSIEQGQKQNAVDRVANFQDQNRKAVLPAVRDNAQAQYNITLRSSANLIGDEIAKRQLLNAQLSASTVALQNFKSDLNAKKSSGVASIASQLKELEAQGVSTSGRFAHLTDSQQKDLELRAKVDQVNSEARKFGLGEVASDFGLQDIPFNPEIQGNTQFNAEARFGKASLQDQRRTTTQDLQNLPDTFRQKRADLTIRSKAFENQLGNPEIGPAVGSPVQIEAPKPVEASPSINTPLTSTLPKSVFDDKNVFNEPSFAALTPPQSQVTPQVNVPPLPTAKDAPALTIRSNSAGNNQTGGDSSKDLGPIKASVDAVTTSVNRMSAAVENLAQKFA
ncbi:MAG: hypothetical protein EKK48_29855 [Candidatus Melainabacteria bacterium]|nr:MAG: hypothetical protein EKK48_29855 [Candidatus Melainabacteria bacterium]